METKVRTRALVCDDDPLVRSVIARVMEEGGFDVRAEADSPESGLQMVLRAQPEVMVLDLALNGGNGEILLRELRAASHEDLKIVVFSAYVNDANRLLRLGATAVVEKPYFGQLETVLADLRNGHLAAELRRPPPRPLPEVQPPSALTLSGLESWESFRRVLTALTPGDAVLALDVLPTQGIQFVWDDVYRMDFRLTLARMAAQTRRPQDRVSLTPSGLPVMLLIAGHPEAPAAVFDRLRSMWSQDVSTGVPVCAFGHVSEAASPASRLDDVAQMLLRGDVHADVPLRMT